VDDFVAKVADSLNLPGVEEWEEADSSGRYKVLKCQGFKCVFLLIADNGPNSTVTLSDLTAGRKEKGEGFTT
jgi:hypothetical protein